MEYTHGYAIDGWFVIDKRHSWQTSFWCPLCEPTYVSPHFKSFKLQHNSSTSNQTS